jgi:hypothetical protein
LNISRFLNKCIVDKKEKIYTKQLESSFLCQILVLRISDSTITLTHLLCKFFVRIFRSSTYDEVDAGIIMYQL